MELIDKTAIVAEINRQHKILMQTEHTYGAQFILGFRQACRQIIDFLDTLEVKDVDLENYISNKLLELGADLINHKPYSFNRGLNVGKTNAYHDILDRLNARKEN